MTTTIPNWSLTRRRPLSLIISDGDDNPVHFAIDNDGKQTQINVDRMALLAALRSELGVLIIDQADLPEVIVREDGMLIAEAVGAEIKLLPNAIPADLRAHACGLLAVANHLEAHPLVDEKQVEALAALLRDAVGVTPESTAAGHLVPAGSDDIARRLVATGKVTVQS